MGGIYAHPRREARPRVHLRYRSATAMTTMSPGSTWLEGRPTRTGKGGSGGVAEPIAALEKLLILSVCGYVIFIEVATELGGIGRLISDRITAEVDTFEDEIALLTKLLALRFADLQSVLHISPAIPPCLGLCCRTGCSVSHRH